MVVHLCVSRKVPPVPFNSADHTNFPSIGTRFAGQVTTGAYVQVKGPITYLTMKWSGCYEFWAFSRLCRFVHDFLPRRRGGCPIRQQDGWRCDAQTMGRIGIDRFHDSIVTSVLSTSNHDSHCSVKKIENGLGVWQSG